MTSAEPVWLRHAEITHKTENDVRIGAPNEAEKIVGDTQPQGIRPKTEHSAPRLPSQGGRGIKEDKCRAS
eukprot:2772771-Pyramimonas_sp.AAC.1